MRDQELRTPWAKSLKTVNWVGSTRGEQIRKAVFGGGEWWDAGEDADAGWEETPRRVRRNGSEKREFRSGEKDQWASSWSADAGWVFPQRAVKLASDLQIAQIITPKNLRMQQDERGTQHEGQAENESDGGQAVVGHQLPLTGSQHYFGAVLTGVKEVMLESPVLSEIIPAIILQLPPVMPELANLRGGEDLAI